MIYLVKKQILEAGNLGTKKYYGLTDAISVVIGNKVLNSGTEYTYNSITGKIC